jgi:hypothetical protein
MKEYQLEDYPQRFLCLAWGIAFHDVGFRQCIRQRCISGDESG